MTRPTDPVALILLLVAAIALASFTAVFVALALGDTP
jgi:hypothetical protein